MKNSVGYEQAADADIWADFLGGSREAYAFIYAKNARLLYNYGYKIAQDRQLTEDCLQDLFLTILETRDRLGETDSIKYYLMRALRRAIVRRLTQRQPTPYPAGAGQETATGSGRQPDQLSADVGFHLDFHYEPTWLDAQISRERSEALLRELNQLPARQKEAIFLKFFDNLSYEEIAGVMGIEQTSAYKIIYKAIAALQKRMPVDLFLTLVTLVDVLF